MRIRAWWCPTEGCEVPLDHYVKGECADPPMMIDRIEAIRRHNEQDTTHAGGNFTITRTMSCPRKVAIEDGLECAPDPTVLNTVFAGTMRHYYNEHTGRPNAYREVRFPQEGMPAPRFLGVEMHGSVDLLTLDVTALEDYKSGSESSHNYQFSKGESKENVAQVSWYKLAVERLLPGAHVQEATIWHEAQVSGRSKAPAWWKTRIPRDVPWMTEEQIAGMKPKDSPHTVREHVEMLKAHQARLAAGMDVKESLRQVPLLGRKMMGGKGCNYCAVRKECDRLEGIVCV